MADSTLCTYTEAMILSGDAHYTYSDEDKHNIRVSNTISEINIRGQSAGTIDRQIIEYNSGNGITKIGPSCFMNCYSLEKVTIQDGVDIIGDNAFRNCKSLSSINLEGKKFSAIGDNAFKNTALTSLKCEYYIEPYQCTVSGRFYDDLSAYFQTRFDGFFKGYKRDNSLNHPGYVEGLDVLKKYEYKDNDFDCWGLGHDCVLIDNEGEKHKYKKV